MRYAAFLLLMVLSACSSISSNTAYKSETVPDIVRGSDINVLIVRHAEATCSDLDCDLTENGYDQREVLASIAKEMKREGYQPQGIYGSAACRTVLTVTPIANLFGQAVYSYPAFGAMPACAYPGDGEGRSRPATDQQPGNGLNYAEAPAQNRKTVMDHINAYASEKSDNKAFFVIVDHSNFVCGWVNAFVGSLGEMSTRCHEGNLAHDDFGDIFWLYKAADSESEKWSLTILDDVFLTEE